MPSRKGAILVPLLLLSLSTINGQELPNTFPHSYPAEPEGDYTSDWQEYFRVKDALPNVTATLSNNYAGSISVNRADHPNNTLFFWGFEANSGALSSQAGQNGDEPWIIWLNGGPGSSSLVGLLTENGPLQITPDFNIVENSLSWSLLADTFWVDQPVGTGYSTADSTGYVADEDQMGEDFMGFLTNLVKVFPSLATRPLYLMGESYAGTYIPYITKTYFSMSSPPVTLAKIAIGDGTLGSIAVMEDLPVVTVLETYPQLIGYDQEVFEYFQTQSDLCGYNLDLRYPQNGTFPDIQLIDIFGGETATFTPRIRTRFQQRSLSKSIAQRYADVNGDDTLRSAGRLSKRQLEEREQKREVWKRGIAGLPNGTVNQFYGCFLYDEMIDYAANFSFPWTLGGFDVYDIPDALNPEVPSDPTFFLNDNNTRAAIHAPTSKDWTMDFNYPFNSTLNFTSLTNPFGDPSVAPIAFLSELATNASKAGISIIFYSGNDDSLVSHHGTEVIIQNMTFGGIQGFTLQPSTPWFDDKGNFAGIIHQERQLTYVLFANASHLVPQSVPEAAFVFVREYVLSDNSTGLVTAGANGKNAVVGGEVSSLSDGIPGAANPIFYGSGTTVSSTVAPAATITAWESFIVNATKTVSVIPTSTISSSASHLSYPWGLMLSLFVTLLVCISA